MATTPQDFLASLSNLGGTQTYGSTPNTAPATAQDDEAGGGFLGYDFSTLGGFGDALMGGKDTPGLLGMGMDLYTGLKQLGLMEDQLELGQDKFAADKAFANRNLANQAQTLNTQLADRQKARLSTGGGYESLESYMDKSRVSGAPV